MTIKQYSKSVNMTSLGTFKVAFNWFHKTDIHEMIICKGKEHNVANLAGQFSCTRRLFLGKRLFHRGYGWSCGQTA